MAKMDMSRDGLFELIGHEAIVQTRYLDSVNVWTIGVGHTKAAGAPDPKTFLTVMPIKDVIALYQKDLARYVADVNKAVKVVVSETEFDALVSFHFNTGGIFKASLVNSLNAGDRPKAAAQFLNWKKPPEVLGRRRKEQKLFEKGSYSNGRKASLIKANASGKVLFSTAKSIDLTPFL